MPHHPAGKTRSPVFYDCEASCLGGLPIEIGWASADPASGEIHSEAHLISPPPHWDLGPVWDPDAQKLHKIARHQLVLHGRPPIVIATRMNDVLAGRQLFSDSPPDDERWLRIIFDEAGVAPTFAISGLHADKLIEGLASELGWDSREVEAAKVEAHRLAPRRHRAEADARNLAQLWLIVSRRP